jgi:hypothetical protein
MLASLQAAATQKATAAASTAAAAATQKATAAASTAAASATKAATNAASSVAVAAQAKAANLAVNAAATQIPGGPATVSTLRKMGVSSTSMLSTVSFFTKMTLATKLMIGAAILIVIGIIAGLAVYFTSTSKSTPQNVTNTKITQAAATSNQAAALGQTIQGLSKREGFTDAPSSVKHDVKLINLQPLTIKDAGFIGPLPAGVFDEKTSVTNAIQAGARSFVLQIDYHDDEGKDPTLFPAIKEPCLLYRDDSGGLISLNAGSIEKFATALAETAFFNKTDPIVLILYCLRAPDPVTSPKDYLIFCSKIAKQLGPLAPFHLGLTSTGDYHRQGLQDHIFRTPFHSFEKKVIIMSNMDTSLFRKTSSLNIPAYAPLEDLDYLTHVQLFKEQGEAGLGVTAVASSKGANAIITSVKTVSGLAPEDQSAWATKYKNTFTVIIPSQMVNPEHTTVETLIKKMGVNVLPMDLFSFDVNDTKRLMHIWDKKTWHLKPHALRI